MGEENPRLSPETEVDLGKSNLQEALFGCELVLYSNRRHGTAGGAFESESTSFGRSEGNHGYLPHRLSFRSLAH
jgi:hypothetical protein